MNLFMMWTLCIAVPIICIRESLESLSTALEGDDASQGIPDEELREQLTALNSKADTILEELTDLRPQEDLAELSPKTSSKEDLLDEDGGALEEGDGTTLVLGETVRGYRIDSKSDGTKVIVRDIGRGHYESTQLPPATPQETWSLVDSFGKTEEESDGCYNKDKISIFDGSLCIPVSKLFAQAKWGKDVVDAALSVYDRMNLKNCIIGDCDFGNRDDEQVKEFCPRVMVGSGPKGEECTMAQMFLGDPPECFGVQKLYRRTEDYKAIWARKAPAQKAGRLMPINQIERNSGTLERDLAEAFIAGGVKAAQYAAGKDTPSAAVTNDKKFGMGVCQSLAFGGMAVLADEMSKRGITGKIHVTRESYPITQAERDEGFLQDGHHYIIVTPETTISDQNSLEVAMREGAILVDYWYATIEDKPSVYVLPLQKAWADDMWPGLTTGRVTILKELVGGRKMPRILTIGPSSATDYSTAFKQLKDVGF